MTKIEKTPTGPFNPFYGCTILVIICLFMAGIVTWVLYSGYRQDKEIGMSTVDQPIELPLPPVTPEAKAALETKLKIFASEAESGKPGKLTLSVAELNALLVYTAESGVADYQGIARFTGMKPEGLLVADLCWPLNRLSFTDKSKRYLIGQGDFRPVLDKNSLDLHVETLTVPGKPVSEGFVMSLRSWPWLNLAKVNTSVAAALGKVTAVSVSPDATQLIVEVNTKPAAPPTPPPAQVEG